MFGEYPLKKIIISFIILCLAGCATTTIKYMYRDGEPISANSFYNSVGIVRVEHKGKSLLSATAFAYSNEYLLTAAHFCIGALNLQIFKTRQESIKLYTSDERGNITKISGVEISDIFTTDDVCMLKRKDHGLTPVKLSSNYNDLRVKDKVFLIGAPSGVAITDFHGKVMATRSNSDSPNIAGRLVVSAASTGGISGSPVFNMNGEVVGILIIGHLMFDHLSVCVPIYRVHEFLIRYGYK